MVELRVSDEDHREITHVVGKVGFWGGGGARWEAFYIDGIHATQEFVTVEREKCKTW